MTDPWFGGIAAEPRNCFSRRRLLPVEAKLIPLITASGTPNYAYALELATDLAQPVDWTPQSTNAPNSVNLIFTNVSASAQGFYRTRYVP